MHIIVHVAPKVRKNQIGASPFLILLSCMLALVIW